MGVVAYHLIMSFYGFWLPNDPRGSWSSWVRSWELLKFGNATKTEERRSLARQPHDRARRLAAKNALARNPVRLTGLQARAIARGFANYVKRSGCAIYACAILQDHAHAVVGRHRYSIEQIANLLKGDATRALIVEGLHPFQDQPYLDGTLPPIWARGQWTCYLNCTADIHRAVTYVEQNPIKERLKPQHWSFVTPFLDSD